MFLQLYKARFLYIINGKYRISELMNYILLQTLSGIMYNRGCSYTFLIFFLANYQLFTPFGIGTSWDLKCLSCVFVLCVLMMFVSILASVVSLSLTSHCLQDINVCILENFPECSNPRLFYIVPYFCGQHPQCR